MDFIILKVSHVEYEILDKIGIILIIKDEG